MMGRSNAVSKAVRANQKAEINGYKIYLKLSYTVRDAENARILREMAENEHAHYLVLKRYSGRDVKHSRIKIILYAMAARLLGLTFILKLFERAEKGAEESYAPIAGGIPEIKEILEDEERHENELINMINESRLNYMGSVVLGLNDALVELTGALAGYTFAIRNNRLIAVIGLITGIAASLSMASSEFLSKKHEGEGKDAFKSSLYTGTAYIATVLLLILPFLLFPNYIVNLLISIGIAILIIFCFNFYISVAKDLSFRKRFAEMAAISIGVALLSFGIGWVVRRFIGVDI